MKTNRYMARNPRVVLVLRLFDAALEGVFFLFRLMLIGKKKRVKKAPARILLTNAAHLGDVVISTSVLPVLRKAFPHAEIGFLVGSWSAVVVKNHPFIDHIHIVDHWKISRTPQSFWEKLRTYFKTSCLAIREIRRLKYDVAIDLYYHFGNHIPVLFFTGIPMRIGYRSGGFGALLTHPLERIDQNQHVSRYFPDLLRHLPIEDAHIALLQPTLAPTPSSARLSLRMKMPVEAWKQGFVVLHMGAGLEIRCWEEEKWKEVVRRLSAEGAYLVFTGKGQAEKARIKRVSNGVSNSLNLCDQLSWEELVLLICHARLLISVNSVPPHIASVFNTPTVEIFCGINQVNEWKACHEKTILLMEQVPCAPCYNSRGCNTMACIRGVTPDQVITSAKNFLS